MVRKNQVMYLTGHSVPKKMYWSVRTIKKREFKKKVKDWWAKQPTDILVDTYYGKYTNHVNGCATTWQEVEGSPGYVARWDALVSLNDTALREALFARERTPEFEREARQARKNAAWQYAVVLSQEFGKKYTVRPTGNSFSVFPVE